MKICTTCGARLAEDTTVCPNDGTPLFARAAAVATSSAPDLPPEEEEEEATMALDGLVHDVMAAQRRRRQLQEEEDHEEPTMAMDLGVAEGIIQASASKQAASPPPAAGQDSTLAMDIDDDLMDVARGGPSPVPSGAAPSMLDPRAALAAAGLLGPAGGLGKAPDLSAPPLDEPTIQMAHHEREEFRLLAKELINQGSDSAIKARPDELESDPEPLGNIEDYLLVDPAEDGDQDSDDEDIFDIDADDELTPQPEAPISSPGPIFEPEPDSVDGSVPLSFDPVVLEIDRESGNLAVASLIDEALGEDSDVRLLPRSAPIAFGDHGVMTSPEMDAPPELDLPAPKRFRRAKKATSRILIALLVLVALAGMFVGTWYYLLPELGYEMQYKIYYLDDYFP